MRPSAWRRMIRQQILGRIPTIVYRHVTRDEAVKRSHILIGAGEILLRPFPDWPGETGSYGIDKDEIALVKQRVLIRDHLRARPVASGLDVTTRIGPTEPI